MDGTGSGQREMQSPPVSTPCRRTGCVFYAHHLFDGMCSKCYKDLKEQMQTSSLAPSPATSSGSNGSALNNSSVQSATSSCEVTNSSSSSVATGSPSPMCNIPAIVKKEASTPCAKSDLDDACSADSISTSPKDKAKKKRCHSCKKRVGLTGFDCRCGGHYCSVHRYSDMHSCAFNYHELAQSEIRRQNPVVAAEKVKKI